jgi:hypothetical protein
LNLKIFPKSQHPDSKTPKTDKPVFPSQISWKSWLPPLIFHTGCSFPSQFRSSSILNRLNSTP